MHVVTPIGNGIGLWKSQLCELDEASTDIGIVCEHLVELSFVSELGSKEIDLCGTVASPAWEHDSIMVLALNQMFGEQLECLNK